jgi:hypothetical protein
VVEGDVIFFTFLFLFVLLLHLLASGSLGKELGKKAGLIRPGLPNSRA